MPCWRSATTALPDGARVNLRFVRRRLGRRVGRVQLRLEPGPVGLALDEQVVGVVRTAEQVFHHVLCRFSTLPNHRRHSQLKMVTELKL